MLKINEIHQCDCLELMKDIPEGSIDLTVTSPPYDNLRDYNGYVFNFEGIANELFRVTKEGGVLVWVVNDATINGSETGTSFRQALYFKDIGFNLHDTMIWEKPGFTAVGALKIRYGQVFEYMFILSKGKVRTFNPIKDRPRKLVEKKHGTIRKKDGTTKPTCSIGKLYDSEFTNRFNVWKINPENSNKNRCHPAQFSEQLANDHIISWSNEGDLILDPMCGSGTTCKMAKVNNRNYIGMDISEEYCNIARKRIEKLE